LELKASPGKKKKKKVSGVAQGVGLEFKLQCQKKKKRKENLKQERAGRESAKGPCLSRDPASREDRTYINIGPMHKEGKPRNVCPRLMLLRWT
jgi:hypothetical protein